MAEPEPLWRPSPAALERAQLTRFRRLAEARTGRPLTDYAALHGWSVEDSESFWALCAEFTGVEFSQPPQAILGPERMPGAIWFEGARLNYAAHLLRRRDDAVAIAAWNESGGARRYTFRELHAAAGRCAAALLAAGVRAGDRVAGYVVNGPEAVIAFLGAAWIGAVWTACSPDFGVTAALDRLGQVAPRLLVASAGYRYQSREFDCVPALQRLVAELPDVAQVVLAPAGAGPSGQIPASWLAWEAWLAAASPAPPPFAELPFDHPLYILFSSGTTGRPKCLVHGAGGALLQHRKEHQLHTGLGPDDTLFYFTTCGWMMWNWLVSALAGGTGIALYDGSPGHPDLTALWRAAERFGVTVFGTSAAFLEACLRADLAPRSVADLARVRAVLSTGSPLSPAAFRWVYARVGSDLMLASIAGGTDIVSCFVLGNPTLPVYAGQIQCLGLGMDVAAYDPAGRAVVGQKGELVCRRPFPSMPVRFWNDPDGSKYREAYFTHFPGVWRHGDFIELTPQGGVIMHGRSDATLKRAGVRIGTSEIYRPLEALPWITDCLAVGYPKQTDREIILFVVTRHGGELTPERQAEIRALLRREASPRHVPDRIIAMLDIPKTRNGKKAELAVRATLNRDAVLNVEALANPECLAAYTQVARLLASAEVQA
ncbi:MAG: acetoacetate--CoA ligase [Actinobacteria bacterium]|nr:acetoacetate--CoA ligase [Actinomycetota bacterium]